MTPNNPTPDHSSSHPKLTLFMRSRAWLLTPYGAITLILIISLIASLQKVNLQAINNYLIFKTSFDHLLEGKDLYLLHPNDHFDYYKYSPTFAFQMGFFSAFPVGLGAIVWGGINAIVPLSGLVALCRYWKKNDTDIAVMMWFIFIELLISIQNMQSNGVIAGLIVWAVYWSLQGKTGYTVASAVAIVQATFIKPFSLCAGIILFLMPKGKSQHLFVLSSAAAFAVLFILPLSVLSMNQLLECYQGWGELLRWDNAASEGLSLIKFLHLVGFDGVSNTHVQMAAAGMLVFPFMIELCTPLTEQAKQDFLELSIASVLIWIVIMNHKAESPTFIFAAIGIVLWGFNELRRHTPHRHVIVIVLWVSWTMMSLTSTDLFPNSLRQVWLNYGLKALPAIVIWFWIEYRRWDMLRSVGE